MHILLFFIFCQGSKRPTHSSCNTKLPRPLNFISGCLHLQRLLWRNTQRSANTRLGNRRSVFHFHSAVLRLI